MSNLLNNGKPKKRLLDRGPKIMPAQEFKLEEAVEVKEEAPVQEAEQQEQQQEPKPAAKSKSTAKKTKKQDPAAQITSVRVTKATRNKLNALIQLGKADSVDVLLDNILEEYIENNLVKEEKKIFNLVYEVIQKRDR